MIENWMELSFHPVFNLDIWHVVEVLNVIRHHRQPFADSVSRNQHIELIDRFSLFPEDIFDMRIFLAMRVKTQHLEIFKQSINPVKFLEIVIFSFLSGKKCP